MTKSRKRRLLQTNFLIITFAAAFIGIFSTFAAAQTDHVNLEEGLPTSLEDAYPTAYRNREVQFYTRYERGRDGTDRVVYNPRFEFGPFRNTQVSVTVPFYSGSGDRTGSGDVQIEAFYNFNTESRKLPAFAVVGRVTAPSGKNSRGLDTAVKFIATKSISNRFDRLHVNLELERNAGARFDERNTLYRAILGYSGRIGADTLFVADFVRRQERMRGENSNVIEAGIRRQLNPLTVLTFGAGVGVGEQSPRFQISIGIQRSISIF
jgi:hypothetical protein